MTLQEVQTRIRNARELDFGTVLSECIELFKKFWLQGFLTIIIVMLISVPIAFLWGMMTEVLGLVTPTVMDFNDLNVDSISKFYGFSSLYNLPISILTGMIQMGVYAGFYRMVKIKDVEKGGSEEYFYFFKQEYLGKLLLLSIINSAISIVAVFLCFLPYIYVIVPLMYFSVVFAFNSEKPAEDILKASFQIGNKMWLITFGSILVCGFLGFLGIIACFIGILFTISIAFFPCYVIYREIVGFEDTSEINEIGKIQEF